MKNQNTANRVIIGVIIALAVVLVVLAGVLIFSVVSGNGGGSGREMTSSSTLTGYTLRFVPSEYGSADRSVEGKYTRGSIVHLTAFPNEGCEFVCWKSSNGGTFEDAYSPKTKFIMPAESITITAVFKGPESVSEETAEAETVTE